MKLPIAIIFRTMSIAALLFLAGTGPVSAAPSATDPAVAAAATASEGELVYGPDWAYLIVTPDGFRMDRIEMRKQGIGGLFYASGQPRYDPAKPAMYIKPVAKDGSRQWDLDSLVAWDLESLAMDSPGIKVEDGPALELGDFGACQLRVVDDDAKGSYMVRGYAVRERSSFIFVLTAATKEERAANEAAFDELLLSFVYTNQE